MNSLIVRVTASDDHFLSLKKRARGDFYNHRRFHTAAKIPLNPPCQRGTLTSDTASLERERLVTYRKRLFHSPPAAGYQNDRQACHSFLRERQSVFDAASCL